ncbi:hypothetical protein Dvar_32140 [Desulfosarcina variabilis str. Montpellier]|uniref:hypothetical protein n=1 Tax=Desulfosarcina variabilis TaxID=2300 RepID=UPI003AFAAE08
MKKPPIPKKHNLPEDGFIQGKSNLPWADANERVVKSFNLRLPEPVHLKLQYIAENTPYSIHGFIMEVVEEAIEQELKKLIN